MHKHIRVFFIPALLLALSGCASYKQIPYFKDVPDSARLSIQTARFHPPLIEKGDLLTVNIQTIDPEANMIFSQTPTSPMSQLSGGGGGQTPGGLSAGGTVMGPSQQTGLLVDDAGNIEIPLLDKIKVDSLTTQAAADTIKARVALLYKLPTVSVRFANFKVSVLGEVNRPGTYIMPTEKNTILDALSMAGDLSVFGKRGNVLMIRDSAGKSNFIRFNLNSRDLVTKDFYFLKQNDVIYIEPAKGKAANIDANQTRIFAIVGTILTLIIVIASRVN